jgi:S-DNA-T family DNA segregation ATPase FtsK/SpoIIIE
VRVRALRFAHEITLIAGFVALCSGCWRCSATRPSDAAWSTSGTGGAVKNWGGRIGAWLADGSYFLGGYSIWWVLGRGVRAWLSTLAGWMRGDDRRRARGGGLGRFNRSRLAFWFGLASAAVRQCRCSNGRACTGSNSACLATVAASSAMSSAR